MISSGTNGDLYDGKGPPVKAFPHPKTHHLVIFYRGRSPLPKVLVRSYPREHQPQKGGLNSKKVTWEEDFPCKNTFADFITPPPTTKRGLNGIIIKV
jgi:hypothetical protein